MYLKKLKLKYEIDKGGGVFYGPKIDIKIKDALKKRVAMHDLASWF